MKLVKCSCGLVRPNSPALREFSDLGAADGLPLPKTCRAGQLLPPAVLAKLATRASKATPGRRRPVARAALGSLLDLDVLPSGQNTAIISKAFPIGIRF